MLNIVDKKMLKIHIRQLIKLHCLIIYEPEKVKIEMEK